ncbi:alpha/beta fold hydrolase [Sagittula sp. NFXS13]|uniref:alpha/beta hydrolase n=1 Tax=Sagittula sp. NFXS13 TaxID=2819095 RepID=UPI0032DF6E56
MTLNRSLKRVLIALLSTIVIFFVLAGGLVLSQSVKALPTAETLSFESTGTDDAASAPLLPYEARDGTMLATRHYAGQSPDSPLVVVVHGSGWHGGAYTGLGKGLAERHGFEVLVPNLRGHGPSPDRRGDVDYISQFEDDLADLIALYRKPGQPLYMVGHSSGGGLTIRFAGGAYGDMLDKAVLIAPYLKYDAPTARSDAGGWSHVLTRRVIGLSMLNSVGITALNHLHMIQFNFPPEVLQGPQGQTATQSYSYRLNTSFAPRSDYLDDVARLPDFLLIAGTEDEAFRAEAYEPTMSAATSKGTYRLIDGADHLGILVEPEALDTIGRFLQR